MNTTSRLIVCAVVGLIHAGAVSASDIEVTLFKLPKSGVGVVTPINDVPVTVTVRPPLLNSAQEVVRNSNDRIADSGTVLLQAVLRPTVNGRHTITIPTRVGQSPQMVNIRFSRTGSADTQVMTGLVIEHGRDYRMDVTVPEELATTQHCVQSPCNCYQKRGCAILRWRHKSK
jgi:hypothetical protein